MFDQTWNGNDKEKQRCGGPHFSNCWNCHCSSCDSIVFVELIIGVMYRRCLTWTQSEGLVLCCLCLSFLLSAFSVQCESLCSSLNYFINAKSKLTMLSRKWRQSYNGLYTSAHSRKKLPVDIFRCSVLKISIETCIFHNILTHTKYCKCIVFAIRPKWYI